MTRFTCYLDESGTHAGSPLTIMGGVLASEAEWEQVDTSLQEIRVRYGFTNFHGTEFKGRSGEFKDWDAGKSLCLVIELVKLSCEVSTSMTIAHLLMSDYQEHYRTNAAGRIETAYGMVFRMCLVSFLEDLDKTVPGKNKPVIDVVIENGHRNAGDAERVFLELRDTVKAKFGVDRLGTFSRATKADSTRLMLADFISYTDYMAHTRDQTIDPELQAGLEPVIASLRQSGKALQSRVFLTPETLQQLAGLLKEQRTLRAEHARKAAD